tara:strand:- start:1138 stop:2319 length:1182 start_codon:yes stop_codon:yes gene_type:complete
MLFQTLDDKNECVGVYMDGEIHYDKLPAGLTNTWSHAAYLSDLDIEYANLYCSNTKLGQACPEDYKYEWESVNKRLRSFLVSFREAKISLRDNCFYDLVPERFLLEYCYLKDKICEHIFSSYSKPENYDFLVGLTKLNSQIKNQNLNIDLSEMDLGSIKARELYRRMSSSAPYIEYDIFGTKTGRLTTTKNSFPILTFNRDYRKILKPKNDWFVELDYNAAELRVFWALLGLEQPEDDIHDYISEELFKGKFDRSETKRRVFSWLYNPVAKNYALDKLFPKNKVLRKYYNNGVVTTPFKRVIESDEYHALNYLIQSTTSDFFLRKLIQLNDSIASLDTFVAFCIHDSVVLDFKEEDKDKLMDIISTFGKSTLGEFKVNVSAGKNFKEMNKLSL